MLNHITIMGRLTKDPELRRTNTGKAVTSFTLAVDRNGRDSGTDFIDCVAWEKTAELADSYLAKGRLTIAEGRLQFRDWTDKNGVKRRNAEVVLDNFYFGDSRADSGGAPPSLPGGNLPTPDFAVLEGEDEEIPF